MNNLVDHLDCTKALYCPLVRTFLQGMEFSHESHHSTRFLLVFRSTRSCFPKTDSGLAASESPRLSSACEQFITCRIELSGLGNYRHIATWRLGAGTFVLYEYVVQAFGTSVSYAQRCA